MNGDAMQSWIELSLLYQLLLSINLPRLILQPQSIINHICIDGGHTDTAFWQMSWLSSTSARTKQHHKQVTFSLLSWSPLPMPSLACLQFISLASSPLLLHLLSFFHWSSRNGVIKDMLLDQIEEFAASREIHNLPSQMVWSKIYAVISIRRTVWSKICC